MFKKVSVVIPCRNEENYISECITSVIDCDYPKEFLEVFVCDGMSTDNSVNIIKGFEDKYDFIKLLINKDKTTPYALNLGIKGSSSEIVIILGAHSVIYPDYISKCVNALSDDTSIGCVGGLIENVYENSKSEAIGLALSSSFGVGNVYFRTGTKDGYVDTVAFGAYKREVFDKIGYFDEHLIRNQDDEFNFRLTQSGYKILLKREIKSKYYVRSSFKKLFNQYFQYGLWKVFVNKKYKTITTLRQLFPALFVLFLFFGAILSILSKIIFCFYVLIFGLYIVLGLYMSISKGKNLMMVSRIFYTFLILHISYGIAYLIGIYRFLILNREPGMSDGKLNR